MITNIDYYKLNNNLNFRFNVDIQQKVKSRFGKQNETLR